MIGVSVKELKFSYGEKVIFDNLSFEVDEGEILTILGPNGSGKTTLLKCLNTLLEPKGCVLIDSFDISKFNEKELAKLIGYVPQMHSPAFPYKVVDVVISGRTPYLGLSMPTKKDYNLAYSVLTQLGLTHLADKAYTQISGGELRLVLIARALVQKPKVLLLDEPTSNLDLKNRVLVLKILKKVAKEGIAIIISEHDPNLASISSDKILLIYKARIAGYGKAQDVLTKQDIEEVYGINVETFERNGNYYMFPVLYSHS